MIFRCNVALVALLVTTACSADSFAWQLDEAGREFVVLALSLRDTDPNYQFEYGGPAELLELAKANPISLSEIAARADSAAAVLAKMDASQEFDLLRLRHDYIVSSLISLAAYSRLRDGQESSFDEESKAIYGFAVPPQPIERFDRALDALDAVVPGEGPLHERIQKFETAFRIPPEKLVEVVERTIDECRRRSAEFLKLPASESLSLEGVTDKPWGAYQKFQWKSRSEVQVNTDIPFTVDVPLTLGCHESYPGHHATATKLEQLYLDGKGWIEFSVWPLFSRAALIHEGTASYAESAVFSDESRIAFMAEVVGPIIGAESLDYEQFETVRKARQPLRYVSIEAARNYLDGKWDKQRTSEFLAKYWLRPPEAIDNWFAFTEQYRTFRINFVLGEAMVANYVKERNPAGDPDENLRILSEIVSLPPTPLLFELENTAIVDR